MHENLILPAVLVLVIIFIIAGPAACYLTLRKIADPVPSWLPLVPAALVLLVMGGILWSGAIGAGNTLTSVLVFYSLTFLLPLYLPLLPRISGLRIRPGLTGHG